MKEILWLLTIPAFLLVSVVLIWVVSPIKGLITGDKLIDVEDTWFEAWMDKIF